MNIMGCVNITLANHIVNPRFVLVNVINSIRDCNKIVEDQGKKIFFGFLHIFKTYFSIYNIITNNVVLLYYQVATILEKRGMAHFVRRTHHSVPTYKR